MRLLFRIFMLLGLLAASNAQAADPNGLYLMVRMVMGSSLEISGWYFKNGQVSNRPMGDIDQFDFKAAAAEAPDLTGNFAIQGKQMTITWANGKKATGDYEPGDHGCFYFDMGSFCPADKFGKGTRLDGVFSGGASAGGGRVANATTLTLAANGQYKLEQVGSVKSQASGGTQLAAGSSGGETGTYELSGTTLTLKPASGKPRSVVSFPYDDDSKGPPPRRLFFDSILLKRNP